MADTERVAVTKARGAVLRVNKKHPPRRA